MEPLRAAWADGKLTRNELKSLANLLLQLCSEWRKLRRNEFVDPPPRCSMGEIKVDPTQPKMPVINWAARVRPDAGSDASYFVDLSKPSCTCADWELNRAMLPIGHLSRCCFHVLAACSFAKPEAGWPGWFSAFLGHRWTPDPRKNWLTIRAGTGLILASTAPSGWADVFAPHAGEYDRFAYHAIEGRWAYDSVPAESDLIQRRIIAATRVAALTLEHVQRVKIRLPALALSGDWREGSTRTRPNE